MDLPSRQDLLLIGAGYVTQRAKKIDPSLVFVEGSDVNIVVGSTSVMGDACIKELGYGLNTQYLDGCFDDELDRYAFDRYQLVRKGASPAVGVERFFRTGTAAGTILAGTKLRGLGGVEYITTTNASFALNQVTARANIRAVQAGKSTQLGANTIREFASPTDIFDGTIDLTNDDPTAGGEDVEDDDTFKIRIRAFWNAARRGTLSAIEFGALTVPGVTQALAIEAFTTGAQPARVVTLYISDSSGVANRALCDLVSSTLREYRAGGIAVLLTPSIPTIVDIVLNLEFIGDVDTTTLTDSVRAAIVEYVNSLPTNGPLYIGDLRSVVRRFAQDGVVPNEGAIVSPTGDLFPVIGQTFRTTLDHVQQVQ